jgi:UPF0716 protein FxsA
MFPLLAILFLLVPIAELAVIITVGQQIGVAPTILLLLLVSVAGAWLSKREGVGAWRRFQAALAEGRVPTTEIADGAMILLAGALLLTPGFLTDVLAVLLLIAPTRALARRAAIAWWLRRGLRRAGRRRVVEGTSHRMPRTRVEWGDPEPGDPEPSPPRPPERPPERPRERPPERPTEP